MMNSETVKRISDNYTAKMQRTKHYYLQFCLEDTFSLGSEYANFLQFSFGLAHLFAQKSFKLEKFYTCMSCTYVKW